MQFFHLKERTRATQQVLLAMGETNLQIEKLRFEIERLRAEMNETLRYQNDINEMVAKEQNNISIQIENLNDAMAQLQAEANQNQITSTPTAIGFVVRESD